MPGDSATRAGATYSMQLGMCSYSKHKGHSRSLVQKSFGTENLKYYQLRSACHVTVRTNIAVARVNCVCDNN